MASTPRDPSSLPLRPPLLRGLRYLSKVTSTSPKVGHYSTCPRSPVEVGNHWVLSTLLLLLHFLLPFSQLPQVPSFGASYTRKVSSEGAGRRTARIPTSTKSSRRRKGSPYCGRSLACPDASLWSFVSLPWSVLGVSRCVSVVLFSL